MMDSDLILMNHYNESLRVSRIPLYKSKEYIVIISKDRGQFLVSKFIFNFLSCFSSDETDIIFAPLSSESLASICQALSLKKVDDISLEDLRILGIFSISFSTVSSASMEDIYDLKEGESDEDEQDVGEAEFKSIEDFSEKKDFEKTDSDNDENSETTEVPKTKSEGVYRNRKRYVGDPLLEWKTINGKEVLATMTCRICGKVFERTNFSHKGHDQLRVKNKNHFKHHKLQNKTCECGILLVILDH